MPDIDDELHFTAWLTVTSTELETDYSDISVLRDTYDNCRVDSAGVERPIWTSADEDPVFYSSTHLCHDVDMELQMATAEAILAEAGWQIAGRWEDVPTGVVVTVTRD